MQIALVNKFLPNDNDLLSAAKLKTSISDSGEDTPSDGEEFQL